MKGRKPALKVVSGPDSAPPVDHPAPSWLPPPPRWPRWSGAASLRDWRAVALLTDDTSGTVESYCLAQAMVRQHAETLAKDGAIIETDAGPVPHPANRLLLAVQREARLLAGELGITPHRFIAGKKKDDDELSDLDL